ncbi:IS21 family transposase, partial [Escherichia coli]
EHMPEAHRQHATWTPERLLEWAGHIDSETHSYVLHILNSRPHPEQSYRFCLGLLNLHKKYSKARLNAACARALKTKVWRLSGIKSILEKGLDKQPVQDPKPDLLSTMEHENVRGSEYYH